MILLNSFHRRVIAWSVAVIPPVVLVPTLHFTTNMILSNICLIPGALYLGVLALWWIARQGTFDIFAYAFTNLFYSFKRGSPKKYDDLYEYRQIRTEKRKQGEFQWLPFLVVGLIMMILAIVFAYIPL